jgi:hypothetical protein
MPAFSPPGRVSLRRFERVVVHSRRLRQPGRRTCGGLRIRPIDVAAAEAMGTSSSPTMTAPCRARAPGNACIWHAVPTSLTTQTGSPAQTCPTRPDAPRPACLSEHRDAGTRPILMTAVAGSTAGSSLSPDSGGIRALAVRLFAKTGTVDIAGHPQSAVALRIPLARSQCAP